MSAVRVSAETANKRASTPITIQVRQDFIEIVTFMMLESSRQNHCSDQNSVDIDEMTVTTAQSSLDEEHGPGQTDLYR